MAQFGRVLGLGTGGAGSNPAAPTIDLYCLFVYAEYILFAYSKEVSNKRRICGL